MNNILVCGLYFSGSSALTDLLSEYEGVTKIPGEFDDIRRAGMLGDHALGKINSNNPDRVDAACNDFWYPTFYNPTIGYYIKQVIKRLVFNTLLSKIYKRGRYSSKKKRLRLLKEARGKIIKKASLDDNVEILKNYVDDVSALYRNKKDSFNLFDQPLFLNCHKELWPRVYDPFKLLIVYRDPRDQIAQLIKSNLLFFDIETPTRGLVEIYGNSREGAIRYEIDTLKARYSNAIKLQELIGKEKVKFVKFESLVLDYSNEKKNIEVFLGLDSCKHSKKQQNFIPDNSSKNIGIYKDYLSKEELALFSDLNFNL